MKYDLSQFKDKKVMIEINGNEELLQACREQLKGQMEHLPHYKACEINHIDVREEYYSGFCLNPTTGSLQKWAEEGNLELIPLSFWEEQEEEPSQTLNEYTQQAYGDVEVTVKDSSEVEALRVKLKSVEESYEYICNVLEDQRDFNKKLNQENEELSNKFSNYEHEIDSLRIKVYNYQVQDSKRIEKINTQKEQLQTLDKIILKKNETIERFEDIVKGLPTGVDLTSFVQEITSEYEKMLAFKEFSELFGGKQ